jgi:hypothetical protein
MSIRFAVAAILASVTLVGTAQQPTPPPGMPAPGVPTMPAEPPRMPARATRPGEDPQKGNSVLRGYVLAADTGNPIRRALVRAMSQDGRHSGMTTTDGEGRFEIRDLLGGRYNLSASKAGYVMMSYGQRRPQQPGTVLEILDGTTVEKLAFSLPRGGVISGTVLDEFGDPVAGAQVNALQFRYGAGGRRLMPSNSGQTDDRGSFRIYGLAPGEYYVSAVLRAPQEMMFTPGSANSVTGYSPTYYPGTPNPAEAGRITVRAAQEASNISMALISARLARISGKAMNSRGAPIVQGMVMAQPSDRMTMGIITPSMTSADGSFQLVGLPPGTYQLTLRPRGPQAGRDAEFANMRLTVGSADVDGLLLTTAPGAIARGIITTDEGVPPPLQPEQISLLARSLNPEPFFGPGANTTVNADWTFEMTGLSDVLLVTGSVAQNPDWMIKAVFHDSVDVSDTPIEFVPGRTVEGLNVVLTRRLTQVSGQVLGERNAPDTDATVLFFSESQDRWGVGSRYLRTARPNQDGRYTLRGLPPHDYLAVAVKDMEPGQFMDPEFLESIRSQAVRISLGEAETKVQDLKATKQ